MKEVDKSFFIKQDLASYQEGGDVLAIASEIAKLKKNNPNIIDGTIGTLLNEEGNVYVLPVVKKVLSSLSDNQIYKYPPTQGPEDFADNVMKYLLKEDYQTFTKNCFYSAIPTPGATAAISNALFISCNKHEEVLIPNPCWGVYKNMCKSTGLVPHLFNMLKDGHFDSDDFFKQLDTIIAKQKHVTIILNDPCNNPVGYSLSLKELNTIIEGLNQRKNNSFTFLYDIAYYEYQKVEYHTRISYLSHFDYHVLPMIIFSASKTFTGYGLRIGAMIYIHHNHQLVLEMKELTRQMARTRWSCSPSGPLHMVNTILSNPSLLDEFYKELEDAKKMLFNRINIIQKEAQEVGLPIIPYQGGFFIAFKCDKHFELVEALKKENIFVLDFNGTIRIAVSGLKEKQCYGLVKKINDVLKSLK